MGTFGEVLLRIGIVIGIPLAIYFYHVIRTLIDYRQERRRFDAPFSFNRLYTLITFKTFDDIMTTLIGVVVILSAFFGVVYFIISPILK